MNSAFLMEFLVRMKRFYDCEYLLGPESAHRKHIVNAVNINIIVIHHCLWMTTQLEIPGAHAFFSVFYLIQGDVWPWVIRGGVLPILFKCGKNEQEKRDWCLLWWQKSPPTESRMGNLSNFHQNMLLPEQEAPLATWCCLAGSASQRHIPTSALPE